MKSMNDNDDNDNTNKNNHLACPHMNSHIFISSLDEYAISLPQDIKEHLFNGDNGNSNHGEGSGNVNVNRTKTMAEAEAEAGSESTRNESTRNESKGSQLDSSLSSSSFNSYMRAMKTAPQITTCRVNLLLSSVDEVLDELKEKLIKFKCPEKENANENSNENVSFQVERHEIFHDVIEIRVQGGVGVGVGVGVDVGIAPNNDNNGSPACTSTITNTNTTTTITSLSKYALPPSSFYKGRKELKLELSSSKFKLNNKQIQKQIQKQKRPFPLHYKVIICDRLCGEAVLRGSNIFVKGVLVADRNIERSDEVCVYAHVKNVNVNVDKAGSGSGSGSAPTRGSYVENYHGHCIFLGMGEAMCSRAQIFNQNTGLAVTMLNKVIPVTSDSDIDSDIVSDIDSDYNNEGKGQSQGQSKILYSTRAGPLCPSMNGILSNKMMLQNLPSCLVAHVLEPRPKDVIADLCCAPGGKTSHVASLVKNDATIVAIDKSRRKMNRVKTFFENMGASCITPIALDSTKCVLSLEVKGDGEGEGGGEEFKCQGQQCQWMSVEEILSSSTPSEIDGLLDVKGFYPNSFDKIVLDPPCSALGLRPKLCVEIKTLSDLNKYAEYQRKFISCAVSLLKKGGILVYSTCTINKSENEEMVRYILDFGNMELLPIEIPIGRPGLPNCLLNDEERQKCRRFEPADTSDTIGFFVAKFRKN